jgi:hypothetical protein
VNGPSSSFWSLRASSASQNFGSFWIDAGYSPGTCVGLPGSALQSGSFSVFGCSHHGPWFRQNSDRLAGSSAAIPAASPSAPRCFW